MTAWIGKANPGSNRMESNDKASRLSPYAHVAVTSAGNLYCGSGKATNSAALATVGHSKPKTQPSRGSRHDHNLRILRAAAGRPPFGPLPQMPRTSWFISLRAISQRQSDVTSPGKSTSLPFGSAIRSMRLRQGRTEVQIAHPPASNAPI